MEIIDLESLGEHYDEDRDRNTDLLFQNILNHINHNENIDEWFHHTIFKYHYFEKMSLRELAKQSDIKYNILQKSIIQTKTTLQNLYNIDYEKIRREKE